MKVIIAGSRTIDDQTLVDSIIEESGFEITEVVSGKCRGVDTCGEVWAAKHNVHVEPYPADWDNLGKAAGPIRNRGMAEYADAAIVIIDKRSTSPPSRGAKSMIEIALHRGIPLHVHEIV